MYVKRNIDLSKILKNKSLFLFGPRQTGKTSYIKNQLTIEPVLKYNLFNANVFLDLSSDPSLIRKTVEAYDYKDCLIVIDEIQELPILLNEVQLMIDERNIKFLLTGSSPRKLKRQSCNLLGGRARWKNFNALSYFELLNNNISPNLNLILNNGLVPSIYLSDDPEEDLISYTSLYLTQEIKAEGITRKLLDFTRFLKVAALSNSKEINYTKIANDAQTNNQAVMQWFGVLEDTLLGFFLEPYRKLETRKSISRKKFYFFDTGVARVLKHGPKINSSTDTDFGEYFEQFIILEIKKYIDYKNPRTQINYIRTNTGFEIDCLLNKEIAIEIKSSNKINERHYKNLKLLNETYIKRKIIVCTTDTYYIEKNIEIMPYKFFINKLWNDEIILR
ncbi:MAG: AAA family ATPase [Sphaerochaetaceae bacterium]|nr:AAA family ATPase [Sphaerochaetaceae bacterium]